MILTREEYESKEERFLAPYAMKSKYSKGRYYPEAEHSLRSAFQRDRDRIVHTNAFRRLEYKTQVFVIHEGDYYRTRLTHTMEVAQIARTLARNLKLNEDLVEAVALAHDLGHTPFGHSGEEKLNKLMEKYGGFEHNKQSLRVVEKLEERYPDFPGLNLTSEVLEGIDKHQTDFDKPGKTRDAKLPTLEAQIVNLSDEIAYNTHDLDDGIKSGLLKLENLEKLEICRDFLKKSKNLKQEIKRYQLVRYLINILSTDLVNQTIQNLKDKKIKSVDDVRNTNIRLVGFSRNITSRKNELRDFLFKNLYKHPRVVRMEVKHQKILADLFNTYLKNFDENIRNKKFSILPVEMRKKVENNTKKAKAQVVCDYIAGMTDRYALEEHKKLFDPFERV